MRHKLKAAPITLCLLLLPLAGADTTARAQSRPQGVGKALRLRSVLQQKLNAFHAAGKFPGATAGFALPDGTSFGLAVGVSDVGAKLPMRESDLMLQGSVG